MVEGRTGEEANAKFSLMSRERRVSEVPFHDQGCGGILHSAGNHDLPVPAA